MVDSVQLSTDEIVLLKQHFRKSQKNLIRERAQAVISSHQGFSPQQISQILLRSEKTVREWIKGYHRAGIASEKRIGRFDMYPF